MAISETYQPRNVKTTLNYADEDKYQKDLEATGGQPDMSKGGDAYFPNTPDAPHEVTIEDIRGREQDFTFEKSGFFLGKHASKAVVTSEDLQDADKVKREYYPEMEKWLKETTGAPRVLIYDHSVRVTGAAFRFDDFKKEDKMKNQSRPIFTVHVDQSNWQVLKGVHRQLPDEAERLLQGRVMLVNVWRPISTVYKHPLCVASAPSVPNSDLVMRPTRLFQEINESLRAKYSPKHQWYYKSFHQPDEVLVFKQFDNYGNAKVRKCAHTAFVDEEFENAEPRQSIELRVFLFWPDFFDNED